MDTQDGDWRDRTTAWDTQATGFGVLRITLLFGSIAIALAMLLTPLLSSNMPYSSLGGPAAGLDTMATGSIRGGGDRYTIRRSVLQPSPDAICVIRENGNRAGAC